MHKIFSQLAAWLQALLAVPCAPDPLGSMTPRELADLPATHVDDAACGC